MKAIWIACALSAGLSGAAFATPDCLESYWDMGERAAVVAFQCGHEGDWIGEGHARLSFCQRQALLTQGVCTGRNQSIPCVWEDKELAWTCHEDSSGNARFDAVLQRVSKTRIHYHAKSHFNEVDLIGTLIPTSED